MSDLYERIEQMIAIYESRRTAVDRIAKALEILCEECVSEALAVVSEDPEMLAIILGQRPECGIKEIPKSQLNGFAEGVQWHTAIDAVRAVLDAQPDGMCWQAIQDAIKGKFYTQSKQPQSIVANAIRTIVAKQEAVQLDANDLYGSPYVLIRHLNGRKPQPYERHNLAEPEPERQDDEEEPDDEEEDADDVFVPLAEWRREAVRLIATRGPVKEEKLAVAIGQPNIGAAKALRESNWFEAESDGWHVTAEARAAVMG